MKEQSKIVHAINYRLNIKKVKELLTDLPDNVNQKAGSKALNGFEKHVIQEGLKEILFGNGPINIVREGVDVGERDITPAMKQFLLDYELIECANGKLNINPYTGKIN